MEDFTNYPFLILFKVTCDYKFKVTSHYKIFVITTVSVTFFCFDLFPQCTHIQTRSDCIHNVKDFIPTSKTK